MVKICLQICRIIAAKRAHHNEDSVLEA
jgi:hypothetical protein